MPAPSTLPEDATKDDIEEYVEQIAKDVEEERRGEESEKDDAQITAEHAYNEKKPAAEKNEKSSHSGDDSADDEGNDTLPADGEDGTLSQSGKADWRKEAKAEAAAYGIGEEELAEFQSREELDRALKLFSRQMDQEREKLKSGETDEKGEAKQEEKSSKTDEAPKDGSYQVRLDPDVYDDELVAEFNAMRDHYESRLEALEGRFNEINAKAEEERFDRSVDALEFAQLFGKTGEESADEMKRRKELFEQVQIEQDVLSRLGRNVEFNSLVQRVARALFAEEYDKRLIKNHTRKISRQADKRQGGGATRPDDPPENPRDFADRLYREMEGE